jgi:biuret amidohydrolase
MPKVFPPIAADPYSWPFDGHWNAADTALLLLGFQTGAVAHLDAAGEVAVAARVLEAARRAGIPVLLTRRGFAGEVSAVLSRRIDRGDPLFRRASPEWELTAGLGAAEDLPVFDHTGDNAFCGTTLEARLRADGVRNLLIAGLPTDGLMHATMRAANDMGFECLAIADACKGTTEDRHRGQLRITIFGNGLFGTVADAAAVLAVLSQQEANVR